MDDLKILKLLDRVKLCNAEISASLAQLRFWRNELELVKDELMRDGQLEIDFYTNEGFQNAS